MFKWIIKRIPTPTYGHYGGYYKRCRNRKLGVCPIPIDWMDDAFKLHDMGTSNSDLLMMLKLGNSSVLSAYGKAYRLGTIAVFSLEVKFGIEHP